MSASSTQSLHVYTLTGNLLAERTLEFEQWSPGLTQRALRETFQVGGKGINVVKMLTRLGAPSTALCFVGGPTGDECEAWLNARRLPYHAFRTTTPTRTGTVVRTRAGTAAPRPETTFLGLDSPADAAAIRACAAFLDDLPAGQILAICGSLPGWNMDDFDPLRSALRRWMARGILVADTYGPPLAWLANQQLSLIKVNAVEFQSIVPAGGSRPPGPTHRWVITSGPGTVHVWVNGCHAEFTPPPVTEVSPTGSGDVLLACIIHAHFRLQRPLNDAVAFALPYAAANAAHPDIAEFPEPN